MVLFKAFIKNYISPKTKKYILNHPIDKVYIAIENVGSSNMFLSEIDFQVKGLTGSEFSMSLIRLGGKQPFPSTVSATIAVNTEKQTIIDCRRNVSVLELMFITINIVAGTITLTMFILGNHELKHLAFSVLLLIILPYLTIWHSLMTEDVLYERFEIYLRKTLNETNFPAAKN